MKYFPLLLSTTLLSACASQQATTASVIATEQDNRFTAPAFVLASAQDSTEPLPMLTINEYARALVHELMSNHRAAEETGMGVMEDKVIKNQFASEYIYNAYKDEKTCGILSEDKTFGTITIAEPTGIICGIVPTTNPTSTAIFKALICLKTRNGIIFSPHPRAKKSTSAAARVVLEAAVKAGAPEGIIGWIDAPTVELSNALMRHPDINLILATGGPGMVKAAYSSGKPANKSAPKITPGM